MSHAFELLDALGWCTLVRRSPDLDGSIPLRAARACVPLLEGNSFGWQLVPHAPLQLARRRGRWQLDDDDAVRQARACVPYLLADGLVTPAWAELLADGPLFPLPRPRWRSAPRWGLWTGLLVRVEPERVLWCGDAGNRRCRDVALDEHVVVPAERWVPLVLELRPDGARDRVQWRGELATLAALSTRARTSCVQLASRPELGLAHLRFYDAQYFAQKQHGPTRKYRQQLQAPASTADGSEVVAALAGPVDLELVPLQRVHGAHGPDEVGTAAALQRLQWRSPLAFTARYDGLQVTIEHDAAALDRLARATMQCWREVYGDEVLAEHRGALLYLSKFFTPHVAGEPHFFVKPAALFATPAGWSMLLQGPRWPTSEVLRGVVHTDRFHAAPAVFAMHDTSALAIGVGDPLLTLLPFEPAIARMPPRWAPPLPTAARRHGSEADA